MVEKSSSTIDPQSRNRIPCLTHVAIGTCSYPKCTFVHDQQCVIDWTTINPYYRPYPVRKKTPHPKNDCLFWPQSIKRCHECYDINKVEKFARYDNHTTTALIWHSFLANISMYLYVSPHRRLPVFCNLTQ